MAAGVFFWYNGFMSEKKQGFIFIPFLLLFAVAMFTCFCVPSTEGTLKNPLYLAILLTVVLILCLLFSYPAFCKKGEGGEKKTDDIFGTILPVMLSGFFVKLCYILYTQVWDRQHDVVDFHAGEGQAAYIEYFLSSRHLPDFDPRSVWGFFQPPLHHIISAIWMKVNLRLGLSERQAQENIQALTFFYMGALMILTYMICRELELKKRGTIFAVSLVSLHPIFILLSGSINNDALSLVLSMFALYLVIVWYKRPKIITIVLLAFAIGLSMFAKLSGGMIAPAVAVLFVIKLIREKGRRGHFLLQYVVFGVICVPVGLFWTVRNMVRYAMPVNYIPGVGQQFTFPFWARLFDFQMESVFPAMLEHGDSFYEHNIFLAILKTSLFGEYNYANMWKGFMIPSVLLFVSGAVLALVAFGATVYLIASKRSTLAFEWKCLFGVLYVTILCSYLSFALSYSNFSAQDFRYAALVIVVEAILLGLFADGLDPEKEITNTLLRILNWATAVFCICSFFVYFGLGFFKP